MCEGGEFEQVALLIDVANCRNLDFGEMHHIAQQQGELVIARAYGNYANGRDLSQAAQELFLRGVQLIHCPAWRNGADGWKSTADETLMNDACRLLFTQDRVTTFIIASGDGHFVPTIREIKKRGKKAIVITGRSQASIELRKTADECILLPPVAAPVPEAIFQALAKAVRQLQKAQSRNAVYPSCVKQKMVELLPGFDHTKYRDGKNRPFKKFIEFLREAQSQSWIRLIRQGNDFLITTVSEYSHAA